jgi:hypothetical protein
LAGGVILWANPARVEAIWGDLGGASADFGDVVEKGIPTAGRWPGRASDAYSKGIFQLFLDFGPKMAKLSG